MGISTRAPVPSSRLLEEISHFCLLLSEPARLQLLCLLRQSPISRQLGQLQQLQESSLR
jgi:hypothetical protein